MAATLKKAFYSLGARLFFSVILACLIVLLISSSEMSGGFCCGALAFCFSTIGLEKLASRVISVGSLRQGVRSSLFWLVFKFVFPGAMIFYALWRGFSPLAIVVGLLTSLLLFIGVLWLGDRP